MQRDSATFLHLPCEIRLQILEYLLHSPCPLSRITRVVGITRLGSTSAFRKNDVTHWRFEAGGTLDLHPQILSVCRQLYAEAAPILYANSVLISVALYSSFSPTDVLGHWNVEDVIEPLPNSGRPNIGRFADLACNIFIDFTRNSPERGSLWISELCALLTRSRSVKLRAITLNFVDGSNGARYSDIKYAALWGDALKGLRLLSCQELVVHGDAPSRVVNWLHDAMVVDPETGVPKGNSFEDESMMIVPSDKFPFRP